MNEDYIKNIDSADEIYENRENLTDEQIRRLQTDDELRRQCQSIDDAQIVMQKQRIGEIDVEEKLKEFHESGERFYESGERREERGERLPNETEDTLQQSQSEKFAIPQGNSRKVISIFIAAAAVIAAIFLITRPKQQTELKPLAQSKLPNTLSITTEKGEVINLESDKKRTTTIDFNDVRKSISDGIDVEPVHLTVPEGKSINIKLPDGSMVYMHPGSRLVFLSSFKGKIREVYLQGQAYFKVVHDADHPFVVTTDDTQTTVLGTEFDVNTKQDATEITLISGSVRVKNKANSHETVIRPGQQAVIISAETSVSSVDILPYKYWSEGILYFDNAELQDILKQLAANFNVEIEYKNTAEMHTRMRFMAERDASIDEAVELMNSIQKVQLRHEDNKIIVE